MGFLKRFALRRLIVRYLNRQTVVSQRCSAVKYRGRADPFQSFSVSQQSEIIKMSVLVGYDIVQNDHAVKKLLYILYAQRLAAIYIMSVNRDAVILFPRLDHPPCPYKLSFRTDEIFANAVRLVAAPYYGIIDMRYLKSLTNQRRDRLVERLLLERFAAAFYKTPFSVYNFPPFFQTAVRGIVGRTEIKSICFIAVPEQNVTDVVGKRVVKKVDSFPFHIAFIGLYPVLIR